MIGGLAKRLRGSRFVRDSAVLQAAAMVGGVASLASAFGLRAEHRDGHAVLVIENRTGHRVPGTTRRDLTFRIQVIDAHDDVVAEHEHLIDHRRYLPVDEDAFHDGRVVAVRVPPPDDYERHPGTLSLLA